MASQANQVLATFLGQPIASAAWNLKKNRYQRLIASMIWHRADTLTTGSSPLSASAATTRISNIELPQVTQFVNTQLGTSANPGPLGGSQGTGTPPHLDLEDLAKQLTSDLQFTDLSAKGAGRVRRRRDTYVAARRRAVPAAGP
jgi:hypothetical protein